MKQNFVQNQPQNDVGLVGQTQVVVADNKGNIKYGQINPNAINAQLLARLAYSLHIGSIEPMNAFSAGTGTNINNKDGILMGSNAIYSNGNGTLLSSVKVSASTNIPYVIYSGSNTISHNGSVQAFAIGAVATSAAGNAEFNYIWASQTAAIAVSSGDTISATWTVSCSTT